MLRKNDIAKLHYSVSLLNLTPGGKVVLVSEPRVKTIVKHITVVDISLEGKIHEVPLSCLEEPSNE